MRLKMVGRVQIAGRFVGENEPCFIIAEAGVNHNGDVNLAKKLVDVAKEAGADAVKFQLYRPQEQTSRVAQTADYQRERTGSANMLEMAQFYELPWDAHYDIAEHCRNVGIIYMASCFDRQAVDFLLGLGGPCIKVASGEITNYPLLAYVAATHRPILLSTGMSTLGDVAGAVRHIRTNGDSPLVLLECVSNYPAEPSTMNLRAINTLQQAFGVPVGFSDHTLDGTVAVAAVALGACVVEKHFTLDKGLPGPDHAMSLGPRELRSFVLAIRTAESALGNGIKQPHPNELPTLRVTRRSLVSARPIRPGEKLDETNVTLKRPATGIDPRLWEAIRGLRATVHIPGDVPITWEMLM